MLVTNNSNQDYWFGPLHLPAGVGLTLTVDDTSSTSLYLTNDAVADAINNLCQTTLGGSGKITVSSQAQPFPRPTGTPQMLHGDGSPEGLIYAPQGSLYMRRDNTGASSSLYAKTTGVTINTGWQAISADVLAAPTGTIHIYAAAAAPTGWLICNGDPVSRSMYSQLFNLITTTYGSGDGSTTFNIPDLRGRAPIGYAASGGHSDVSTLGLNDTVASAYRRPKHRHTPHTHSITPNNDSNTPNSITDGGNTTGGTSGGYGVGISSSDGGSGNTNDSLDAPAYIVLNYIIKT